MGFAALNLSYMVGAFMVMESSLAEAVIAVLVAAGPTRGIKAETHHAME
jgi:hypothetical protein